MPAGLDTYQAWKFGQALKPLRDMKVLIVASGGLPITCMSSEELPAKGPIT
ncbi:hypothetical protein D3C86_2063850 [compost metagenome]